MRRTLNAANRRLGGLLSAARLARLGRLSGDDGERIARVVQRVHAPLEAGSGQWIDRIEAQRRELLSCEQALAPEPGDLDVSHDIGVSVGAACRVSKSRKAATLLHLLVRAHQPNRCIELGTNVGISAAYQAAALALIGKGRLTTLETSTRRIEIARRLSRSLGLSNIDFIPGSFEDCLEDVLSEGVVDYAFIDGNHRCGPTLAYFDAIWQCSSEGALIVFDDIRWSKEMTTAWRRIQRDDRVRIAVDLWEVGVCVTTRQPSRGAGYRFGPILF